MCKKKGWNVIPAFLFINKKALDDPFSRCVLTVGGCCDLWKSRNCIIPTFFGPIYAEKCLTFPAGKGKIYMVLCMLGYFRQHSIDNLMDHRGSAMRLVKFMLG